MTTQLRFSDTPFNAVVHSVYRMPTRTSYGLTSCNKSFTYDVAGSSKDLATNVAEAPSCFWCLTYGP